MNDSQVLQWMGMLGHPYAITCKDGDGRRSLGETNTEEQGRRFAREHGDGRVFKRRRNGHYVQVYEYPEKPGA